MFFKPGLYSRLPCSSLLRTDPARSGEEQPDPALLSEAGPAAAPGPGDQHCRAGSARLRRAHASCVFVNLCFECALVTLPRLSVSKVMERLCVRVQQQVCVLRGVGEVEEIQAAKQVLKEARNSRAVS